MSSSHERNIAVVCTIGFGTLIVMMFVADPTVSVINHKPIKQPKICKTVDKVGGCSENGYCGAMLDGYYAESAYRPVAGAVLCGIYVGEMHEEWVSERQFNNLNKDNKQ